MSASIMEIGRLTNGTKLPVTDYEEPYGSLDNSVIIPFNVLWEEARNGITKLVHFSFRNVHEILGQAEVDLSNQASSNSLLGVSRSSMSINSRVISASLGRGRAGQQIQFPHTIQVNLQHLTPVSADSAVVCVAWDYQVSAWTNSGCTLISTNKTNSVCRCNRMSAYTVMLTPHHNDPAHIGSPSVPIMTLQIVTYIVAAISVLCVVLILIKVSKISPIPQSNSAKFDTNLNFIAVSAQHSKDPLQDTLPQSRGKTRLQSKNSVMLKHGSFSWKEHQPHYTSKF